MLDLFEWKIIDHVLQHGPCTERAMRDYRIDRLRPEFNWGTTKPRLDNLIERRFLVKTQLGYDVHEPGWKKIVEEVARLTGKLVPGLSLRDMRALLESKDSSRIMLKKIQFDLVGYRKRASGSHGIVKGKMEFRPGPIAKPDLDVLRQ